MGLRLLTSLRDDGTVDPSMDPALSREDLLFLFRKMLLLRALDEKTILLQRAGRIGFYVPSSGQEAAEIGSGYALREGDWVFPSYRDHGVALLRGYPLETLVGQLFCNASDALRGRQMPNHWCDRAARVVSVSSPVATQLPQAVGASYAAKLCGDRIGVIAYFGDGGSSTGDFHAGMNFAGVFRTPTVFFCSNNQYAISLPVSRQTCSASIAEKAAAKPFDVDELLLKVRALLRRSEIYKTFGARKNVESSFSVKTPLIVLIDDDVSLSKMFQYNLKKAGFECLVANTAQDGLELAKKTVPDVIVSDIMMPEVDGYELRRLILNEPSIRSIPFIFLTAKGSEKDILDGFELDITDYVLKTAGPKIIVAKVSAIIKSLGKERAKAVQELHRAADSMRVKVVPDYSPQFDGFEINHWHQPFGGIPGGDFLDYFMIDQNRLAIILGDVMGKRWGAWFFALAYAGYIRSAIRSVLHAKDSFSPGKIIEKVNKAVYQDSKISEVFTTLSLLILDKEKSEAHYSGAGDLPILYKKCQNKNLEKINSDGLLLGFSSSTTYEDSILSLSEGDSILLSTDGIIESRNGNDQAYGSQRFVEFVNSLDESDNLIQKIKADFYEFTSSKFEDDISLISVKVKK